MESKNQWTSSFKCFMKQISFHLDKTKHAAVFLRWETLIVQFLNCASDRSEFKVPQMISSQFRVIFVKRGWASRFLTLLNVEISENSRVCRVHPDTVMIWSGRVSAQTERVFFSSQVPYSIYLLVLHDSSHVKKYHQYGEWNKGLRKTMLGVLFWSLLF